MADRNRKLHILRIMRSAALCIHAPGTYGINMIPLVIIPKEKPDVKSFPGKKRNIFEIRRETAFPAALPVKNRR